MSATKEIRRATMMEEYHKWLDLWITLDRWLREYPPGDKRHDDAEHDLAMVGHYLDCAEAELWRNTNENSIHV